MPYIESRSKKFSRHSPISFSEFKEWLLVPVTNETGVEFSHISVYHEPPSIKITSLGDELYLATHSKTTKRRDISADTMVFILEAYENLLKENKITVEQIQLIFKNITVWDWGPEKEAYLTKKQFIRLQELGVKIFVNLNILGDSPKPFPFNSLALDCDKRAKMSDEGILQIPDGAVLTQDELNILERFYIGKKIAFTPGTPNAGSKISSIKNHVFEKDYKIRHHYAFEERTINGYVDLSTQSPAQKSFFGALNPNCSGFNIQNTTFNNPVNLCNAFFHPSEVNGATFKDGIIFNANTDFSKWTGNVKMPDNAKIIYVNKASKEIHTTVKELYEDLKSEYEASYKNSWASYLLGSDFIKDELRKFNTNGEKLFKLLQHMQEQKNKWFFKGSRTQDAFEKIMGPKGTVYLKHRERVNAQQKQTEQAEQAPSVIAPSTNAHHVTFTGHMATHHIPQQEPPVSKNSAQPTSEKTTPRSDTSEPSSNSSNSSSVKQESTAADISASIRAGKFKEVNRILNLTTLSDPKIKSEIKEAIEDIFNNAYREVITDKKTTSNCFNALEKFLDSELANNAFVTELLPDKIAGYAGFRKSAQLSIEITKHLDYLKRSFTIKETGNDKYYSTLSQLANSVSKARHAEIKLLYWMDNTSCKNFKVTERTARIHSELATEKKLLANILPDGEFGTPNRLIYTTAIPKYISEAFGISKLTQYWEDNIQKKIPKKYLDTQGKLIEHEEADRESKSRFFSQSTTHSKNLPLVYCCAHNMQAMVEYINDSSHTLKEIRDYLEDSLKILEKYISIAYDNQELKQLFSGNVFSELKNHIEEVVKKINRALPESPAYENTSSSSHPSSTLKR